MPIFTKIAKTLSKMAEIHITDINYIEINSQSGLDFKYKPEVPKLKLVGTLLMSESEEEEDGVLFLTQKQLNQVLMGKEVDLKLQEDRWLLGKPLTKDQVKKVGLVDVDAEYMGTAGEFKCFEAVKISE
ncbi:hypothetical protein [Aurantibacillus circumpalustris]|uniref:hypothetical protein n=1 Tax=Aurantibacillus circumpalustris TaxID=3036359 RepID=UPI00295A844A|nr:hypothetical protein [Aurantibacillus circumpalustris]